MDRYNRHIILPEIGEAGQKKLNDAKVLVVGAGGLGSPVLTYLTAVGVGKIGIVDNDVVSITNLQRQILYAEKDVNLSKSKKAKERLIAMNSEVEIEVYQTFLSENNSETIAKGYDVIVDCTDNYKSRYVIDNISKKLNVPMVYGSISQFNGQVSVFNYKGSKSYSCLFPDSPPVNYNDESRLGVIGTLPGIVGSIQANEVIKLILGFNDNLVQKLFLIDTKTMVTNIIDY